MVAGLLEGFGDLYKDDPYSVPCGYLPQDPTQTYFYFDKSKKKCVQSIKTWICPSETTLNIPQNNNIITCETGNIEDPCPYRDYTFDPVNNICIKK